MNLSEEEYLKEKGHLELTTELLRKNISERGARRSARGNAGNLPRNRPRRDHGVGRGTRPRTLFHDAVLLADKRG